MQSKIRFKTHIDRLGLYEGSTRSLESVEKYIKDNNLSVSMEKRILARWSKFNS